MGLEEPNHFKGMPMSVIAEAITLALSDEFDWWYLSDMQLLELRARIDRAMWKAEDYAKEIYNATKPR